MGMMTMLGELHHALPYLIPGFRTTTATKLVVVVLELQTIVSIQHCFMETPIRRAMFQVQPGGRWC